MRILRNLFCVLGIVTITVGIFEPEKHLESLPSEPHTLCEADLDAGSYILRGSACTQFPYNFTINGTDLVLFQSSIKIIHQEDFMLLSHIKSLALDMNVDLRELSGRVFSFLKKLENLTITNNNQLQSVSTNTFLGLVNLRHLILSNNDFSDFNALVDSLWPLSTLETLDLSGNAFRTIDGQLLRSQTLKELRLSSCSLACLDGQAFNNLPNLAVLYIDHNGLDVNPVTNLLSNLSSHTSIAEIHMNSNPIHDSSDVLDFLGASRVSYVDMSRTFLSPLYFNQPLPYIEHLDLSEIGLSDASYFTQFNFPRIRSLRLAHNRLFSIMFQLSLPTLKSLDLTDNCWYAPTFLYGRFRLSNATFLEELVLDSNPISVVNRSVFQGLTGLRRLSLKNTSISAFTIDPFIDLVSLEELDLSNNLLSNSGSITNRTFTGLGNLTKLIIDQSGVTCLKNDDMFVHLPNLQTLSLRGNSLLELHVNLLQPATQLQFLDLTSNWFQKWDQRLFEGNPNLRTLYLNHNQITTITAIMMQDLAGCEAIFLDDNPFSCSCEDVSIFFSNTNTSEVHQNRALLQALSSSKSMCSTPEGRRFEQYWSTVETLQEEDECEVIDHTKVLIAIVAAGVLLTFLVGIPLLYYLRWHIKYWIFLLRQALSCYLFPRKSKPAPIGKYSYDAFVSYSNADRGFVVRLVTMLESHPPNFRLCVFERDFAVGGIITDNVVDSLSKSKRTILILSDSFARSTWCQWEMSLAQHKRLFFKDDHHDPLIIIKIGEIMEKHMTPTLRYLTKTRIYLQWNSDPIKQKVFWKKLRGALAAPISDEEGSDQSVITNSPERNNNANYWIVSKENNHQVQATLSNNNNKSCEV